MHRRVGVGLVAGLALGSMSCAGTTPPSGLVAPPAAQAIRIDAVSVPLNPGDLAQFTLGDFHYAGGLHLTSGETDRLHGLSDMFVTGTDRMTAVGDEGILLDARLVLDAEEGLVGVDDARLTILAGEDGRPLVGKEHQDAEGLASFPGGDRLVSFERHHRIWLYPAAGGPPRPVPSPEMAFPPNGGMEALAADPEAGGDAYLVGAEQTGDLWACQVSVPMCLPRTPVDKPAEFGLVAMTRLSGMQTAYLLRAYDEARGSRILLTIVRSTTVVARMELAAPLTIDNFEGLAAVPRPDGRTRFYLISDDNANALQRTLLLAFDWQPR